MTKEMFLSQLRTALTAENINNTDSLVEYYNEMICDRMEDGMDEEAAVEAMGPIDKIVKDVSWDRPIGTLVKEKVTKSHETAKNNGKSVLWIVLLIIGAPVWMPITLTLLIVLGVIYLIPWILIFVFFIVLASLAIASVACLISFIFNISKLNLALAFVSIGGALILAPLCVALFNPIIWLAHITLRAGAAVLKFIKRIIF